ALALEIYLTSAGFDLASLWEDFLSSGTRDLRTTGPWWGIAGLAFVAGGITAAALNRLPPPWHRFRLLRWIAAILIVLLVEDISHSAGGPGGVAAGVNVAVRLAALGVAAVMALAGAYIAVRRLTAIVAQSKIVHTQGHPQWLWKSARKKRAPAPTLNPGPPTNIQPHT